MSASPRPAKLGRFHPDVAGGPFRTTGLMIWRAVVLVATVAILTSLPRLVLADEASARSNWTVHDLFAACNRDCGIFVFGGQSITRSPLQRIALLDAPVRFDGTQFFGLAFSRPLVDYSDWFGIEAEVGAGKRFGNMRQGEFWGALYVRLKPFPNNRYLRTTVAVSTGLNVATGISPLERRRSYGNPKLVLHNFSPEITFALPKYPDEKLVFRIQHRSGLYGLINEGSGTTFVTVGIRHFF